jgi:LAGLIDADG-like domain
MIRRHIQIEARWFHWLCGILEGEGTIARATPSAPRRPRVVVCMTDRDIIARVADLIGTRVYTHKISKHYRQAFRTELVGGSAVALMELLRPVLSERRQTQIDAAVATYQPLRLVKHKSFLIAPVGEQEAERYWLAGYLEGEAYFGQNKTARLRISPIVEVNTTDLDVALRVSTIWYKRYGVSISIYTRRARKAGYKPQYMVRAVGDDARWIIADIYGLLGARRRARIDDLLGGEGQRTGLREAASYYDVNRIGVGLAKVTLRKGEADERGYSSRGWHRRARRRPREYTYGLGWPRRAAADRHGGKQLSAAAAGRP